VAAQEKSGAPSDVTRRLFFALWPSEMSRTQLVDRQRHILRETGGQLVPPANFHVTLAFLGTVAERCIPELQMVAQRAARAWNESTAGMQTPEPQLPRLQIALDRIEYWQSPKILCATASATPIALSALADFLKRHAIGAGFSPDLKPFRTHVTLARKVPSGSHGHRVDSTLCNFSDFVLVDSRTASDGPLYSVLKSWTLCTKVCKNPEKKHK
jgi:2'-5' RNA ligase